jgi:ABC-type nickel/cobalt efflux system permease component RcnA
VDNLKEMPVLGGLLTIIDNYPRISAWVVLSLGVVGILVYEARDVDLTTTNWIALIVASVLVSGLCIWIVSWEDEEELEADSQNTDDNGTVKNAE